MNVKEPTAAHTVIETQDEMEEICEQLSIPFTAGAVTLIRDFVLTAMKHNDYIIVDFHRDLLPKSCWNTYNVIRDKILRHGQIQGIFHIEQSRKDKKYIRLRVSRKPIPPRFFKQQLIQKLQVCKQFDISKEDMPLSYSSSIYMLGWKLKKSGYDCKILDLVTKYRIVRLD